MTTIHLKAPNLLEKPENFKSIFLGGSIENGKAHFWQEEIAKKIEETNKNYIIYNPRRENWNSDLKNSIDTPEFKEQVQWEYDHLEKSDIILLYFQPGTLSPISLLELGLFAGKSKIIVCCQEGFWRKGNVDFICEKFGIIEINSLEEIIDHI